MPQAFPDINLVKTPIGVPLPYTGSAVPTGFLYCNGQAVSRTTYAALFAIIGITAGQGDGSTTFNVPDYRGRFLRAVSDGTARDPDAGGRTAMQTGGAAGDNVNSIQGHQLASHLHPVQAQQKFGSSAPSGAGWGADDGGGGLVAINSSLTGGNETRPVNAYVRYIIKF